MSLLTFGITLILLSIIAVPSLVLSKHAHAGELLSRIAPYQGWIGLAFCFWGLWGIIQAILNLGLISSVPIFWVTFLTASFIEFALGFLLGYGMISKLILSKNEEAMKKGEALLAKLAPWQGKLGLLGVIIGAWTIVEHFIML